MRSCREVTVLLSQSLEEPLPLGVRMSLRLHMLMCKYCSRYYRQIKLLRDLAGAYARHEGEDADRDQRLSQEARERINTTLKSGELPKPG